ALPPTPPRSLGRRCMGLLAVALLLPALHSPAARDASVVLADRSLGLVVTPVDPWTATLSWTEPPAAVTTQITRDGWLVDRFPSSGGVTYTDRVLWPHTTFSYEVQV